MPDYSGNFKMSGEDACDISIVITKNNENYLYKISAYGSDYTQNIIIDTTEGQTYLVINSKIEDTTPKTVNAMFSKNSLFILN